MRKKRSARKRKKLTITNNVILYREGGLERGRFSVFVINNAIDKNIYQVFMKYNYG